MTVFNMFTNSIDRKINEIGAEGEAIDLNIKFNQDLKVIKMRPNQKYVYENYLWEQYFAMIEPMGAGKSMTLKYLGTKLLEDDENLKIIIIVPRTLIANTFKKETLEYPDGTVRKWDIGKNLCDDHYDKIGTLISFLEKTKFPKGIRNRVCVATHIAFAMLQDRLEDIDDLFDNTLVIIDEAHHILSPDYDVVATSNKIGGMVYKILKRNHKSTSLWLVSATLFRGDRGNIIPPDMYNMFTEHFLPFDQHWKENIKYIETFEYNFVIYKDIMEDIQTIIKNNKEKTIIFCPYNGHLLNGRNKFQFRDELHDKIKEVWPNYKKLDLIDPEGRNSRKKQLETDSDASAIDIIYALKLFDEGTDWKFAAQAIDAAPKDSLSVQMQKLGRILRDLKGKKHVSYNILFPHQSVFETEADMEEHLKKMFAILAGAMILREAIQPLPYPQLPEPKEVSLFEEAVPNPRDRKDIIQKISEELISYADEIPDPTPTETREKIKEILKDEFNIEDDENYSVTTHIGMMLKRLEKIQSPSSIPNKPQPNWEPNTDISWMVKAGYDKIFEKSIYDTLLMFGTAAAGVETFDEFRRIYKNKRKVRTLKQWVKFAENLANTNNGVLKSPTQLIKDGHYRLVSVMYENPKAFEHIPQKLLRKKLKQSVEIAKSLAKMNNGILQNSNWLRNNGFTFIVRAKLKHPEAFKGIKQMKQTKRTLQEVKSEINDILIVNNGKLYSHKELVERGLGHIYEWLKTHPREFKNIKRDYLKKSVEHWVKVAKDIILKEKILPNDNELIRRGLGALPPWIRKRPELFKGIKQYFNGTHQTRIIGIKNGHIQSTVERAKKKIKKLLKENNGILYSQGQLQKMGLYYISRAIRLHPEEFKGIKQYLGWSGIRTIGE